MIGDCLRLFAGALLLGLGLATGTPASLAFVCGALGSLLAWPAFRRLAR